MFLYWRVWIGVWVFVISLLVAGFQGSTLVRFFTKFTKDIFASLVALLFIFEAFNKLVKIFKAHPLQETYDYCSHLPDHCHAFNVSSLNNETRLSCSADKLLETSKAPQPNTALMSMILMLGTFFIAPTPTPTLWPTTTPRPTSSRPSPTTTPRPTSSRP